MKLSEALVLSIDTETTGPDPTSDRVVELGGAYLRGTERLGPGLRALVNPGIYIPAGATNVHGIRNEDIEKAEPWPGVAARLKAHLDQLQPVLTGYNLLGFDAPLINAENRRNGLGWELPPALDTFVFAWYGHRELRSRKLSAICELYGVPLPADQAHTATFVASKVGFDNPAAAPYLGSVHVLDIGIPQVMLDPAFTPRPIP